MASLDWDPDRYLELMREDIPGYFEFQDAVAAATEGLEVDRALELGVGTGETARRVLERHPRAGWTAIDANDAMLARAGEVLPGAELVKSRLEDPLPDGPFDLVVSSLAVHHLDGAGKRDLFQRVHDVLRDGGTFVLGDVVVPEHPRESQIEIDWVVDLPDRLDDQLEWLRAAGFEPEVRWVHKDLAVVSARRPQRRG
jgi:tRNA (cmo5U34)-methyltransferase